MNTPAHLIMGAAAFGKPLDTRVTIAALIGAMIPDASLYLLAGWELVVMGTPGDVVFGEMYFSDAWQQVFAIDNSFVLWGLALLLAVFLRSGWAIALTGAALLHVIFDFPLHNEDARMHFWPLIDWKFYSPFSYWDSSSGGRIIGVVEAIFSVSAVAYLLWLFKSLWWRGFFCLLLVLELWTVRQWILFF